MKNPEYKELFERNIGLISEEEQRKLKDAKIALFGLGGLGGVIAEVLARSGIGQMSISDCDSFVIHNSNRQIYCNTETLGKPKTQATAEALSKINPAIKLSLFSNVDAVTTKQICQDAGVAILAIDKTRPWIHIARECFQQKIPLVEGWAIPFINVRTFTHETPTLEEVYQMPSSSLTLEELDKKDDLWYQKCDLAALLSLSTIDGVSRHYSPESITRIQKEGRIPSFAPLVWQTAVAMALEAIKVLLKWEPLALAPQFALYDPFRHIIPSQNIPPQSE